MEIYDVSKVYQEFNYPKEFLKIVELNLVDFDFWYLMSKEQVEKRIKGLKERYPDRELVPFARRDDSDDIACFDIKKIVKSKLFMILQVLDMNREKSIILSGNGLRKQYRK